MKLSIRRDADGWPRYYVDDVEIDGREYDELRRAKLKRIREQGFVEHADIWQELAKP